MTAPATNCFVIWQLLYLEDLVYKTSMKMAYSADQNALIHGQEYLQPMPTTLYPKLTPTLPPRTTSPRFFSYMPPVVGSMCSHRHLKSLICSQQEPAKFYSGTIPLLPQAPACML
jgi:hypothetical protein